jgi:hypothetical protein
VQGVLESPLMHGRKDQKNTTRHSRNHIGRHRGSPIKQQYDERHLSSSVLSPMIFPRSMSIRWSIVHRIGVGTAGSNTITVAGK